MIELKQELAGATQRVQTLEKKCTDLTQAENNTRAREEELRHELEMLKEGRLNQMGNPATGEGKASLEQENEELRAEVERLIYQIGQLKAKRNLTIEISPEEQINQQVEYKKTVSTEDSPRQESVVSKTVEIKLLEERCAALAKERKSIEEILER